MSSLTRPAAPAPAATLPAEGLLHLSRLDVEHLDVSLPEVVKVVEDALRDRARGLAISAPKHEIETLPGNTLRAMPAYDPRNAAAGVKWIAGFPTNVEKGLPTMSAVLLLSDVTTGRPTAVMDATWITAARTAACSALSVRRLARPDARVLAFVACGLQARTHVEALKNECSFQRVLAYDLDPAAARRFAEHVGASTGLEVEVVDSAEVALARADVVVTSLPISKVPPGRIGPGVLRPGSLAVLLDFDAALSAEALSEADRLVTDDVAQVAAMRSHGYLRDAPMPDTELGDILVGTHPGRTTPEERVLTMNLGIALLDVALGAVLLARARQTGSGTMLSL